MKEDDDSRLGHDRKAGIDNNRYGPTDPILKEGLEYLPCRFTSIRWQLRYRDQQCH